MAENSPLDLYARIEPMIGFYDAYEELYGTYLAALRAFPVSTVLDVGCGNGTMLLKLQEVYEAKGIDLSPEMVRLARAKGANAHLQRLEEERGRFDALLAVADVLNYLDKGALETFLRHVHRTLRPQGLFLADINTLFGFEEITSGSLIKEEPGRFLAIDARFEEGRLTTDITLFEEASSGWRKSDARILQHYHDVADIMERTELALIGMEDIALFGDMPDKTLLILQKREGR